MLYSSIESQGSPHPITGIDASYWWKEWFWSMTLSSQNFFVSLVEATLCRTLRVEAWWLPHYPASPSPLLVLREHFLDSNRHTPWLRICCWRIWLKNIRTIMDLLFIVNVEVGSHGNSLSNRTHASSNINDGCNGTSMNKSSHNSSRRESFRRSGNSLSKCKLFKYVNISMYVYVYVHTHLLTLFIAERILVIKLELGTDHIIERKAKL